LPEVTDENTRKQVTIVGVPAKILTVYCPNTIQALLIQLICKAEIKVFQGTAKHIEMDKRLKN
jgi:hypothetical protein